MDFYNELIAKELGRRVLDSITFYQKELQIVAETKALWALGEIKRTLDNTALDDFQCIEEIICILEQTGSHAGARHDL